MTERTHVQEAETAQETGTSTIRSFAQFMTVAGLAGLVTPLMPIAAVFTVVGAFVWIVSYAVEPVEEKALQEAKENGGGCGWLLVAALMIIVAGMAFIAVAGTVLEVGA